MTWNPTVFWQHVWPQIRILDLLLTSTRRQILGQGFLPLQYMFHSGSLWALHSVSSPRSQTNTDFIFVLRNVFISHTYKSSLMWTLYFEILKHFCSSICSIHMPIFSLHAFHFFHCHFIDRLLANELSFCLCIWNIVQIIHLQILSYLLYIMQDLALLFHLGITVTPVLCQ